MSLGLPHNEDLEFSYVILRLIKLKNGEDYVTVLQSMFSHFFLLELEDHLFIKQHMF